MASEGDLIAGKYRLERFIGSGGFASVWAARNEVIDRPLALKILSDTYARKAEIVTRFLREARIACRAIHPVVLRIEDVVQAESGAPFLVMELLEGHPLAVELKRRKVLSVAAAVTVMRHVLAGLAAVHGRGIIHRDVKPSNIFLMA
jgi:serine/threonine protein kinase